MIEKHFVLAGQAIFTLDIPQEFCDRHDLPSHYTYRVTKKEASERYSEVFFASLLTGPDNTSDYTYMGMIEPLSGEVRLTRASKYSKESWPYRLLCRVLTCLWQGKNERIIDAHFDLHHEGRCCRCGRVLTVPESILSGIGPECAKKAAG